MNVPILQTARLRLRPLLLADAEAIETLAGAPEVAATTLNIPHPYPKGAAEGWVRSRWEAAETGDAFNWAITRLGEDALIGSCGLGVDKRHMRAEMGYWLGVPYWNRGYMTEAAAAVLAYGFNELALHRIQATALPRNPGIDASH